MAKMIPNPLGDVNSCCHESGDFWYNGRMSKIVSIFLAAGIAVATLAEGTVEIRATGLWGVAGESFTIEAKAKSSDGGDLSRFRWCLCDASGSVVLSWKRSVSGRAAHLKVNLPAGVYRLRAMDGAQFCGDVPVRVMPRENKYARILPPAEIHEPPDPETPSGPVRLWRDLRRKEFSQAPVSQQTPRRIVARLCTAYPERVDDLAELVDRTASDMKSVGENALACPVEWDGAPDHLGAWYVRFDAEGLKVFPMLELGADAVSSRSARHELQRRIDGLVDSGMRHKSFGGICIRVARQDMLDAPTRARLAHALSKPRTLWVVDDADLAELTNPLRAGDAAALAARGAFGSAARRGARISFIQAFRTLPAVTFNDADTPRADALRLRQATYEGMNWFYAVNTGATPARVKLEVPARTRDLAKDTRVGGLFGAETLDLVLGPFEMRAYATPESKGTCKVKNAE